MDVSNTLKTIKDLQSAAVDGIGTVKAAMRGPLGWGALFTGVVKFAGDVKDILADAPAAMPELKDLDAAEVGQIGAASYDCVKAIKDALAAA